MSPTLNDNPTLFVIPCNVYGDSQCCKYCHLPSIFHPNFNHKLMTREGRVYANGWTHLSSLTKFVHLFTRSVIQKITIVRLNIIFSVFILGWKLILYNRQIFSYLVSTVRLYFPWLCIAVSYNIWMTDPETNGWNVEWKPPTSTKVLSYYSSMKYRVKAGWPIHWYTYHKLCNVNPHNVTHSLISRKPREWIFVVQISLLIVIFLSLISQNLSIMQTTKEVNPHPCIVPCVNMWSVTFLFLSLFLFFLCHLLNVGACTCHIAWESQGEWTTPS